MPSIGAPPGGHRDGLHTRFAGQLRVNSAMGTDFVFLNVRAKPFDEVRVRRTLSYALDRDGATRIYGGPHGPTHLPDPASSDARLQTLLRRDGGKAQL